MSAVPVTYVSPEEFPGRVYEKKATREEVEQMSAQCPECDNVGIFVALPMGNSWCFKCGCLFRALRLFADGGMLMQIFVPTAREVKQ